MMNPEEVKALLRKVTAYCPAMKMTADSPLAWAEALSRYELADCLQAVGNLGAAPLEPGKSRWIEPGHVAWEVQRIRARRVADFDVSNLTPPPGLDPGNVQDYLAWVRGCRALAADGRLPEPPALESKPTGDAIKRIREASMITKD